MKLKLVKKVLESKDTYSHYFEPDIKFDWKSGQYLVFKIDNIEKQFTIASSPTENEIRITTRIRKESIFKQSLNKLEIGQEIEASGPFGSFVFPHSLSSITCHLFLAGGIGITPFRSMIKYSIDKKLNSPMFLIYSNSDSEFVFKNELDNWQKENDLLKIYYHDSSLSGHIDKKTLNHFISDHSISCFWVVGPTAFVNAMEDILDELSISDDHVKTEKFIGY